LRALAPSIFVTINSPRYLIQVLLIIWFAIYSFVKLSRQSAC
jgi:flagellar biogenesis protein FliO